MGWLASAVCEAPHVPPRGSDRPRRRHEVQAGSAEIRILDHAREPSRPRASEDRAPASPAALAYSGLRSDLRLGHELTEVVSFELGIIVRGNDAGEIGSSGDWRRERKQSRDGHESGSARGFWGRSQGIEFSQRYSSHLHIFFVHRVDHPQMLADDDRMRILISLRLEFP